MRRHPELRNSCHDHARWRSSATVWRTRAKRGPVDSIFSTGTRCVTLTAAMRPHR